MKTTEKYSREYVFNYKELADKLGIKENIIAIKVLNYSTPSKIKIYTEV